MFEFSFLGSYALALPINALPFTKPVSLRFVASGCRVAGPLYLRTGSWPVKALSFFGDISPTSYDSLNTFRGLLCCFLYPTPCDLTLFALEFLYFKVADKVSGGCSAVGDPIFLESIILGVVPSIGAQLSCMTIALLPLGSKTELWFS